MPYGGNPSTDGSDAVRLLVGDLSTSTSGEYLADGDYDYFIAQTPNQYVAAALAANSLAALFMGAAASGTGSNGYLRKRVGDLELEKADATKTAESYRLLSKQLSKGSAGTITPYAGGISRSDKASVKSDADRVEPAFARGQFDSPRAKAPEAGSTST